MTKIIQSSLTIFIFFTHSRHFPLANARKSFTLVIVETAQTKERKMENDVMGSLIFLTTFITWIIWMMASTIRREGPR